MLQDLIWMKKWGIKFEHLVGHFPQCKPTSCFMKLSKASTSFSCSEKAMCWEKKKKNRSQIYTVVDTKKYAMYLKVIFLSIFPHLVGDVHANLD